MMNFWKILRRTSILVFILILLLAWLSAIPSTGAGPAAPDAPRAMPKIP
jgi:hypothetical protein